MWAFIRIALAVALSGTLAAQAGGPQRPRVPSRPSDASPRPDGRQAPATATLHASEISGRVTYLESGRPVRRATVTAVSTQSPDAGIAVTGRDGVYRMASLKPGVYRLRVQGDGLVDGQGEAAAPGGGTKTVSLSDRQAVTGVDFVLSRGAVVVGRVVDEDGEPFAGALVSALRYQASNGTRRLLPVREPSRTNDAGEFRLFGLPPGKTIVKATYASPTGDEALDPATNSVYLPIYYPGTASPSEAQTLDLQLGTETTADFQIVPVRGLRLAGTALGTSFTPLVNGMASLSRSDAPTGETRSTSLRPDGSFSFLAVPPGPYVITVVGASQPGGGTPGPSRMEVGSQNADIVDRDVDNVQIVTQGGGTVRGRIEFDGQRPSSGYAGARVACAPMQRGQVPAGAPSAAIQPSGAFELRDVFGPCLIGALLPGAKPQAIRRGEQDFFDTPIDVAPGGLIEGVVITFSATQNTLAGTVTDDSGRAVTDYTVIVFPGERERWRVPSRLIQTTRADQNGIFHVTGLPAGSYLAVALSGGSDALQWDLGKLEALRPVATRANVVAGVATQLQLRLTHREPD